MEQLLDTTVKLDTEPDVGLYYIGPLNELIVRLPIFSSHINKSKKIIGAGSRQILNGDSAWIHRTLESIKDETILHKLLLRLFQAIYPKYAQNVHGSYENGRDLFFLPKDESVLRIIQVKCGDLSLPDWRKVKPQLEEMMETDIPQALKDKKISKKVGILLFTGHIRPNVESAITGWKNTKKEQVKEEYLFEYLFKNLDDFVNFIYNEKLISEFHKSLSEYGIKLTREHPTNPPENKGE